MVPGKGLRIESVHPDDEGTYVCEASNVMGRISAEAALRVRERPVISVRPQARLRRPASPPSGRNGRPISLACLATGTPKPAVFWMREGEERLIMPGSRRDNMYVTSDGALKIEEPISVENGGHFACTALNVVGAAIARSHLVVFDPVEANSSTTVDSTSAGLEKARLSLLEKSIEEVAVQALGPTSLRVTWKLVRSPA